MSKFEPHVKAKSSYFLIQGKLLNKFILVKGSDLSLWMNMQFHFGLGSN